MAQHVFRLLTPLCVVPLLLAGCTHGEPPKAQLAVAESAFEDAQRSGAVEHAPVDYRAAQDKLQAARQAVEDKDYVVATRLAEEAEVDARLADLKARAETASTAAQQVNRGNQTLRQELEQRPAFQ